MFILECKQKKWTKRRTTHQATIDNIDRINMKMWIEDEDNELKEQNITSDIKELILTMNIDTNKP